MSTWPANRLSNLVMVIAGGSVGDSGWPYSGPRRRGGSNRPNALTARTPAAQTASRQPKSVGSKIRSEKELFRELRGRRHAVRFRPIPHTGALAGVSRPLEGGQTLGRGSRQPAAARDRD